VDIRNILDWGYYFERLSTQVQKMVCIPAVLQGIPNPVSEIELPEWLQKKTFDMKHHKQQKILGFIQNKSKNEVQSAKKTQQKMDVEAPHSSQSSYKARVIEN
jgi:DNA polymerase epsilon subunit 1